MNSKFPFSLFLGVAVFCCLWGCKERESGKTEAIEKTESQKAVSNGSKIRSGRGNQSRAESIDYLTNLESDKFESLLPERKKEIENLIRSFLSGPNPEEAAISLPLAKKFLRGRVYDDEIEDYFSVASRNQRVDVLSEIVLVRPGKGRERALRTASSNLQLSDKLKNEIKKLFNTGLLPEDVESINKGLSIQSSRYSPDFFSAFVEAVRGELSPENAKIFYSFE
ncbi:hypothetical protein [Roseibacillus persicicus]|uniref:hypothetical protein n=1 Tax=Roseibacillus persicicus TaxID=454148 RepID=UPI00280EBC3E|nr:hypothetical protein [Roseibacillus persicicus]MDQ8192640.1 hypothetical protein [Roseibacillus persicicus]